MWVGWSRGGPWGAGKGGGGAGHRRVGEQGSGRGCPRLEGCLGAGVPSQVRSGQRWPAAGGQGHFDCCVEMWGQDWKCLD